MQTGSEQSEALGRIKPISRVVDQYVWDIDKRPAPLGYVYFVTWGNDNPVKIGWSESPERRLLDLQCSFPYDLDIRRVIPALKQRLEKQIHHHLSNYKIRGEWFRQEGLVRSVMAAGWGNENIPEPKKFCQDDTVMAYLRLKKDEDAGLSVRSWSVADAVTKEKYISGLYKSEAEVIIQKLAFKTREEVYRAVRAIKEKVLTDDPRI